MYFWLFDWNFFPRFLKDSGVIGLLHFFSRWLLWAITLPFKLLLGAALRLGSLKMIDYYEMRSSLFLIVYLFHFFFFLVGGLFCSIYVCTQAVYKYFREGGSLTLQHFIMFFGAFELVLSQLPNIHSLRWVNALCTFSTIGFAATTIGVTIYDGGLVMFSFACCIIALLLEPVFSIKFSIFIASSLALFDFMSF